MAGRDIARLGLVDGAVAVVLAVLSLTLAQLEDDTNRHKWIALGLGFAVTLLVAGLLQLFPRRWTLVVACGIHGLLLGVYAFLLLLCILMVFTILLIAAAMILAVPTLLLALNSLAAVVRIVAALRMGLAPKPTTSAA